MSKQNLVGVINYGSGNYTSVCNALAFLGAAIKEVQTPADFHTITHIILPGVGAFDNAVYRIKKMNLLDVLINAVREERKMFLGICVGLQILAEKGHEFGVSSGLSLIPGEVVKMNALAHGLRLPHIGWNEVSTRPNCPLFAGMKANPVFYFVNSYHFRASRSEHVVATCEYGETFTAAVQKDNIFGVQFHPEKSQGDGLKLLKNFINLEPFSLC